MAEEDKLKQLKKEYAKFEKKYSLPTFEQLNQDFYIEKTAEIQTDYLIREVRRFMADRFSNYLRFIESVINPVNVPIFVFSIIKAMTLEDKKRLTEAYKKLARIEVDLVEVDIEFAEEKEAEFIKESFEIWQEIKKDVLEFIASVQKNWHNKVGTNDKGYFG